MSVDPEQQGPITREIPPRPEASIENGLDNLTTLIGLDLASVYHRGVVQYVSAYPSRDPSKEIRRIGENFKRGWGTTLLLSVEDAVAQATKGGMSEDDIVELSLDRLRGLQAVRDDEIRTWAGDEIDFWPPFQEMPEPPENHGFIRRAIGRLANKS